MFVESNLEVVLGLVFAGGVVVFLQPPVQSVPLTLDGLEFLLQLQHQPDVHRLSIQHSYYNTSPHTMQHSEDMYIYILSKLINYLVIQFQGFDVV